MTPRGASRLTLCLFMLCAAEAAPLPLQAAPCPKEGCPRPAAPPPRPQAPVHAQPVPQQSFHSAPNPAGVRPGGAPYNAQGGAPMGGFRQGPVAHIPEGPHPGPMGSTVYSQGHGGPGPVARGSVYSPNRTFTFHGRSFPAFRARPYRYARGYGYRVFYPGQRFPPFLLLSAYFITNYNLYNLTPPPELGLVWVRFGPDALLVNTYTGEVVDRAPGIFDEGVGAYGGPGYPPAGGYPPPPPGQDYPPPSEDQGPPMDSGGPPDGDGTPYPGPTGYPEPPAGPQG